MNRALRWICGASACGALCALAPACRAPGEPPTHPNTGVYRDIIRREADSTHTALATAKLLITTADSQGLPTTYAHVTLRSIGRDLRNVVIDLAQIHPPPTATNAQGRLEAIAAQDAILIIRLQHDWGNRALRTDALRRVSKHADEITNALTAELQH